MSLSPTETQDVSPEESYLDAWGDLARRIQNGSSFSGRERNCCFLNTTTGRFADASSALGLDQIDDSRALAVVDWDHDGDLDLWTSNRTGPRVRFLRNDLADASRTVSIRLVGSPQLGCPRDAIGARVVVSLLNSIDETETRHQTLSAGDSFLSQSSKWLHFALTSTEKLERVEVRWPGADKAEVFENCVFGRNVLRQGDLVAEVLQPRDAVELVASVPVAPAISEQAQVRFSDPPILSEIDYRDWANQSRQLTKPFDQPVLVVLWASWCQPCLQELRELSEALKDFAHKPRVLALNVESLTGDGSVNSEAGRPNADELQTLLNGLGHTGESGFATDSFVNRLTELHNKAIYRKRSLPLPSSVLLDPDGVVRAIYKGPLRIDELRGDLANVGASPQECRERAIPFAGRWGEEAFVTNPIAVTNVQMEQGYWEDAQDYLKKYLSENPPPPTTQQDDAARQSRFRLADIHRQLATIERRTGNLRTSLGELERALAYNPRNYQALVDSGTIFRMGGKLDEAYARFLRASTVRPDANMHNKLGVIRLQQQRIEEAMAHFRDALEADPDWHPAANNLAWLLATRSEEKFRDGELAVWLAEKVCRASNFEQPQALDTYAAALAENGQFEKAVETADKALRIARAAPANSALSKLIEKLERRKAVYESKQPLRE